MEKYCASPFYKCGRKNDQMTVLNPLIILVNGITLALALAFLSILLWNDAKKELNQFFAVFLLFVALWNGGSLLWQAFAQIDTESPLISTSIAVVELGFTGASVAVYTLTAVLVRAHTKRFRVLAFASISLLFLYRLYFILGVSSSAVNTSATFLSFQQHPLVVLFYLVFDFGTLALLWRYRRKVRSIWVSVGLVLFVIGQTFGFLNPELRLFALSNLTSAIAALILSFAVIKQEIISPLAERNSQVEVIRKVSMAITSLASIETVLDQIAKQTASLLQTEGAVSIFLVKGGELEVGTVHNLPNSYVHSRIAIGEGMAGTAALKHQTIQVDDYGRDWKGQEDFPLARKTFGAAICTPLIYAGETIGVLMMVAARHGILFQREDAYLLELLGAQASVAISHSQLFGDVELARSQLETVLSSTDNPVIALDRKFSLIFANPSAQTLLNLPKTEQSASILEYIPQHALPVDLRAMLSTLRATGTYTYEAELESKVYLCNIAHLGRPRVNGWVAVLHDVTQLKELDRLKSEMVRMTSHDLKNPLQAAMANVDLLREDLPPENAESIESLDKIDWQLQRMNRIIRGILDLERMKPGIGFIDHFSPAKIVEDSIQEMRHFSHMQKVNLKYVIGNNLPLIRCDLEQFRRALVNLVENAIKFTPANGEIYVKTYTNVANEVIFEVSDTGVGIAPEVQSKVFDRFYRAQQKGTEHITGTGIGLSLVKTIVESHKGTVWLESELGKGTTFFIKMPAVAD